MSIYVRGMCVDCGGTIVIATVLWVGCACVATRQFGIEDQLWQTGKEQFMEALCADPPPVGVPWKPDEAWLWDGKTVSECPVSAEGCSVRWLSVLVVVEEGDCDDVDVVQSLLPCPHGVQTTFLGYLTCMRDTWCMLTLFGWPISRPSSSMRISALQNSGLAPQYNSIFCVCLAGEVICTRVCGCALLA